MCGIVGLFLKNVELEAKLGAWLAPMLTGMSERGPDSAGFAVYRPPPAGCTVKLTLHHPDERYPWPSLRADLAATLAARCEAEVRASHCVLASDAPAEAIRRALAERYPEVRLMGIGETIEIFKEKGRPEAVAERFHLADLRGSHAVGHTRMATESAVTTEHSHPFSTGLDLCLVHNGSLSNHNRLRLWLEASRHRVPDRQRQRGRGRLSDLAAERGRESRPGAGGGAGRSRRLLHLRGRHARRLRRAARQLRLQARGARRDRRLGRDGLRIPLDRASAGR